MEAGPQNPHPPEDISEEELRAAYEEQLKQVRVEDVLVQTVVSLLNLGGRKAGLAPGTEDERDPDQLRAAIEGTRALLPLVEEVLGPDAKQLRDVLSQLQMAYTQLAPGSPPPPAGEPEPPADPGPPPPSGRIWVPGQ
ncbi:MAG: hypothetical protein ACJ762_19350 [Solirubrobacteraceae bacterium]